MDLIDIEDGDYTEPSAVPAIVPAPGDQVGYISFRLRGVELTRVSLAEFIDPSSNFYDPSVVYGNRSGNRIEPMTAQELGIVAFDQLVFDMGMCYGIDNLEFQQFNGALPEVPEPSSLATMGLG
ncbi:MAG: hypothetical protein M3478_15130, partial [Planctomycetota bacterium]|nr:hypothetical protein [Planctomycetota bacterium]